MPNLEELFRLTFEDKIFTRKERQALSKVLKEEDLEERELAVLRSKVFDMVASEWQEHEDQMILNWLYAASKLLLPKDTAPRSEVFFSPGEACRTAIIKGFRSARNTADVCVFTISDNVITKEILHCHKRGVRVRIITDNDKIHDRGSDIFQMARAGIPTKIDSTDYHMHHKFAIFDRETALTGSYNWTRSAAAYNEENLLVTNDLVVVRRFQGEFQKLWEELEELS